MAANAHSASVVKTEEEWKQELSAEEYAVLREKDTERPNTGKLNKFYPAGGYFACRGCKNPLYSAQSKFDSGCGWPAFDKCFDESIVTEVDTSFGRTRIEIMCKACLGHLGHVFQGERMTVTNERHCVNRSSDALAHPPFFHSDVLPPDYFLGNSGYAEKEDDNIFGSPFYDDTDEYDAQPYGNGNLSRTSPPTNAAPMNTNSNAKIHGKESRPAARQHSPYFHAGYRKSRSPAQSPYHSSSTGSKSRTQVKGVSPLSSPSALSSFSSSSSSSSSSSPVSASPSAPVPASASALASGSLVSSSTISSLTSFSSSSSVTSASSLSVSLAPSPSSSQSSPSSAQLQQQYNALVHSSQALKALHSTTMETFKSRERAVQAIMSGALPSSPLGLAKGTEQTSSGTSPLPSHDGNGPLPVLKLLQAEKALAASVQKRLAQQVREVSRKEKDVLMMLQRDQTVANEIDTLNQRNQELAKENQQLQHRLSLLAQGSFSGAGSAVLSGHNGQLHSSRLQSVAPGSCCCSDTGAFPSSSSVLSSPSSVASSHIADMKKEAYEGDGNVEGSAFARPRCPRCRDVLLTLRRKEEEVSSLAVRVTMLLNQLEGASRHMDGLNKQVQEVTQHVKVKDRLLREAKEVGQDMDRELDNSKQLSAHWKYQALALAKEVKHLQQQLAQYLDPPSSQTEEVGEHSHGHPAAAASARAGVMGSGPVHVAELQPWKGSIKSRTATAAAMIPQSSSLSEQSGQSEESMQSVSSNRMTPSAESSKSGADPPTHGVPSAFLTPTSTKLNRLAPPVSTKASRTHTYTHGLTGNPGQLSSDEKEGQDEGVGAEDEGKGRDGNGEGEEKGGEEDDEGEEDEKEEIEDINTAVLRLSCTNLPCFGAEDASSVSPSVSPLLVLWGKSAFTGKYERVGHTEWISNQTSPVFIKPLLLPLQYTRFRISVYNVSEEGKISDKDFLCSASLRREDLQKAMQQESSPCLNSKRHLGSLMLDMVDKQNQSLAYTGCTLKVDISWNVVDKGPSGSAVVPPITFSRFASSCTAAQQTFPLTPSALISTFDGQLLLFLSCINLPLTKGRTFDRQAFMEAHIDADTTCDTSLWEDDHSDCSPILVMWCKDRNTGNYSSNGHTEWMKSNNMPQFQTPVLLSLKELLPSATTMTIPAAAQRSEAGTKTGASLAFPSLVASAPTSPSPSARCSHCTSRLRDSSEPVPAGLPSGNHQCPDHVGETCQPIEYAEYKQQFKFSIYHVQDPNRVQDTDLICSANVRVIDLLGGVIRGTSNCVSLSVPLHLPDHNDEGYKGESYLIIEDQTARQVRLAATAAHRAE